MVSRNPPCFRRRSIASESRSFTNCIIDCTHKLSGRFTRKFARKNLRDSLLSSNLPVHSLCVGVPSLSVPYGSPVTVIGIVPKQWEHFFVVGSAEVGALRIRETSVNRRNYKEIDGYRNGQK